MRKTQSALTTCSTRGVMTFSHSIDDKQEKLEARTTVPSSERMQQSLLSSSYLGAPYKTPLYLQSRAAPTRLYFCGSVKRPASSHMEEGGNNPTLPSVQHLMSVADNPKAQSQPAGKQSPSRISYNAKYEESPSKAIRSASTNDISRLNEENRQLRATYASPGPVVANSSYQLQNAGNQVNMHHAASFSSGGANFDQRNLNQSPSSSVGQQPTPSSKVVVGSSTKATSSKNPVEDSQPWQQHQHHHYMSQSTSIALANQQSERYICPTCNKTFSRPSSLRIHCHSHTGEKPFVCSRPGCGKAFSVRSNMKRHEKGCQGGSGGAGSTGDMDAE